MGNLPGSGPYGQVYAGQLLKAADDGKKLSVRGFPLALNMRIRLLEGVPTSSGEILEADGRVDVIAKHRLSGRATVATLAYFVP
jgi:hypothetical protein